MQSRLFSTYVTKESLKFLSPCFNLPSTGIISMHQIRFTVVLGSNPEALDTLGKLPAM